MYIPGSFAEHDPSALFAFMESHPLATLVTQLPGEGLFATHLPLVVDRAAGPHGTLIGHLARANPQGRLGDDPVDALVIFAGPDAYITPSWYPSKQEHGRVVPTWNYVAVHVNGAMRIRDDVAFMREHLESLTQRHEAAQPHPWAVGDAPEDYLRQQMRAIIGVEIRIDRVEGKWKMSQNRPEADIDGVIRGLHQAGTPQSVEVAEVVKRHRPGSADA